MKDMSRQEKLCLIGGFLALGAMGLIFSMVLAGAGLVLLLLASALMLTGLLMHLLQAPELGPG